MSEVVKPNDIANVTEIVPFFFRQTQHLSYMFPVLTFLSKRNLGVTSDTHTHLHAHTPSVVLKEKDAITIDPWLKL